MSRSPPYHVSVIMAGLWPPAPQAQLRLAGLELLLARGEREASEPGSLDTMLFRALGASVPSGDLPVAAVTRILDMGVVDSEWWFRADPVHLVARRDGLVLVPGGLLDLPLDEAQRLCEELGQHYEAEGWLLRAPHPWRWYLRPPRVPDVQTTPLALAVGHDVHACLPTGNEARSWHTLLNEMQILLHAARVNAEREQRGAPSINSLWFWGGGRVPRVTASDFDFLWTDEVVAQGLSRLSGIPTQSLPEGFEAWRDSASPGRHLIVLGSPHQAAQDDAEAGWSVRLADLENRWFRPLTDAVCSGTIAQLTLTTDQGLVCRATGRQLRRWWRRRRPLSGFTPSRPLSA